MSQTIIRAVLGAVAVVGLANAQVYDPNMPNLNGPSTNSPAPSTQTKPKTAPTPPPKTLGPTPAKTLAPPPPPPPSSAKAPSPKTAEPPKPVDPLAAVFSSQPIATKPASTSSAAGSRTAPSPAAGATPIAPGSLPGIGQNAPLDPGSTKNPISIRSAKDGEFVTSSVHLANPLQPGKGVSSRASSFTVANYTLKELIEYAWVVHPHQVEGGPPWFDKEAFTLGALMPTTPRPNSDQRRRMTQTVLEKRFLLQFHLTKKDMPVYRMIVAEGGVKMTARRPEESALAASTMGLTFGPHLPAQNVSTGRLAALLQSSVVDRPVIDQTGLSANYDFELKWHADASQFDGRGAKGTWHGDDKDPDLFTAMQKLGLKLEPVTMPVEIIVVDSATRPLTGR